MKNSASTHILFDPLETRKPSLRQLTRVMLMGMFLMLPPDRFDYFVGCLLLTPPRRAILFLKALDMSLSDKWMNFIKKGCPLTKDELSLLNQLLREIDQAEHSEQGPYYAPLMDICLGVKGELRQEASLSIITLFERALELTKLHVEKMLNED